MRFLIAVAALFAVALTGLAAKPVLKPGQNKFTFTGEFSKTSEVDQPPMACKLIGAQYPQARVTGEAQVVLLINAKGFTEQMQVVTANDEAFGDAARES